MQTAKEDPALFLQCHRPPVLIDEIQKAPELLPYIKEIVDASDQTGTVWFTGSQPFHLMKEVFESLAGRVGVIEMLALSDAEISGVPSEPFSPGRDYFVHRVAASKPYDVVEAYNRICAGSLPGIRSLPQDLRAGTYESHLDTYIMRDIRDLSTIGDELKFRRFMTACAALTSKPVVYAELARIADIDEKTASPSRKDARNLNALDPVNAPDVVPELSMFKRKIGAGTIVCMAQETFPVSERA